MAFEPIDFNTKTFEVPTFKLGAQYVENAPTQPGGFAKALDQAFTNLNDAQNVSQTLMENFASGDKSIEVHEVMMAVEKAGLMTDLTLQVRNRMVDAYNDIIRMQI